MKLKTKLTKLGRNPIKQKGFINPGIYKGSTMVFKSFKHSTKFRVPITLVVQVSIGSLKDFNISD